MFLYNAEMSWYKAKGVKTFVWTLWFLKPFRTDYLPRSTSHPFSAALQPYKQVAMVFINQQREERSLFQESGSPESAARLGKSCPTCEAPFACKWD